MTVTDIQEAVRVRFLNHKYDLCNTYVFNGWECDWFAVSKTGYVYEVEIKLTRSDFFADFKKGKHKLFEKIRSGKTYTVKNQGPDTWSGEIIGEVRIGTMVKRSPRRWTYWNEDVDYTAPVWEQATHYDYLNNYENFDIRWETRTLHAAATRIKLVDLTKTHVPHRFYYACPEGLIKPEEVPAYAGLIYVRPGRNPWSQSREAIVVKEAPFIHKRPLALNGVLLDKFYWEATRLRNNQRNREYDRWWKDNQALREWDEDMNGETREAEPDQDGDEYQDDEPL